MDAYIGMIIIFGGNFQIRDWAFCNGQLLPISQYTALFSILGTTYGGNGVNNFALPNLQGRMPIGFGNGAGLTPRSLGEMAGTESTTLLLTNLPAHTHAAQLKATSTASATGDPTGALLSKQPRTGGVNVFATGAADTNMAPTSIQVGVTGSSQPVGIMPPFLAVNYLIALNGIFPSRN